MASILIGLADKGDNTAVAVVIIPRLRYLFAS